MRGYRTGLLMARVPKFRRATSHAVFGFQRQVNLQAASLVCYTEGGFLILEYFFVSDVL